MQRRKQTKKSFQEILISITSTNAHKLMERARTANRLAKSVSGKARTTAYQVKLNTLIALAQLFPEQVTVSNDPCLPGFVVVEVPGSRFGLHLPLEQFIERN